MLACLFALPSCLLVCVLDLGVRIYYTCIERTNLATPAICPPACQPKQQTDRPNPKPKLKTTKISGRPYPCACTYACACTCGCGRLPACVLAYNPPTHQPYIDALHARARDARRRHAQRCAAVREVAAHRDGQSGMHAERQGHVRRGSAAGWIMVMRPALPSCTA
ncbi:uncharacterized protein K452DRAFT_307510 [Aplosporella prunicola CBS 121167]|uniref:Copper-fist domain-containing protein n=1 Tax=Aplosporella prunicola CBS 121167 TaxID=1176127 RepID=A0A6A6BHB0_9PEZI|nr:uncharacterized protein K452DRAFT_307510 [Aplosporella prunicola CBS 121167]KAF2143366.1 hypothetical protein K452DRAFT_307510 [Aplosporella prunicola CBS 121167]